MFMICEDLDVEIVLLVESNMDDNEYEWRYAFAPFSNYELDASLDEEEVWQVGPRPDPVPSTSPRWALSGLEHLPEPQ